MPVRPEAPAYRLHRLHGAALGLRMTVNQLAQINLPLGVGACSAAWLAFSGPNSALLAGQSRLSSGGKVEGSLRLVNPG